jgi:hypothetical protein
MEIDHSVSRAEALFLIVQAAWHLNPSVRQPLIDGLIDACLEANSWRGGRILRDVVLMISKEDLQKAQSILASIPENRFRRSGQRSLVSGQSLPPRAFF